MTRARVVLAEDHPVMAQHLRALLASEHEVIDIVQDGRALIETVEACRPDVVVCDIAMPGLSGLAAARVLLDRDPEARIVFVTVRDERAVIRKAMSGGARGYVVKCDAGDELPGAVRTVLGGGYCVSFTARAALEGSGPGAAREGREIGE